MGVQGPKLGKGKEGFFPWVTLGECGQEMTVAEMAITTFHW